MSDQALADKIVALGVGRLNPRNKESYGLPMTMDQSAHFFVRDWRVAGALMEKWTSAVDRELDIGTDEKGNFYCSPQRPDDYSWNSVCWITNESLPRAIIEACVEALT